MGAFAEPPLKPVQQPLRAPLLFPAQHHHPLVGPSAVSSGEEGDQESVTVQDHEGNLKMSQDTILMSMLSEDSPLLPE
jgi:hypothetical protein